ncbi:hypothetical protein EG339_18820 [Chryseobacterium bernardetii]|uniref:Uncharacterized protein n=1 Tax=Chryseobacterium bernardetii TaxID=1241978 RepID=A0A3G6TF50_9FLAO|nr:hypothetical protein EG339_18820 [Chryseobacterium bernardetii]
MEKILNPIYIVIARILNQYSFRRNEENYIIKERHPFIGCFFIDLRIKYSRFKRIKNKIYLLVEK